MAVTADKVIVELDAKIGAYEQKMGQARRAGDKAFDGIGKAANDAERVTTSSMGRAASSAERAMARIASAARTGRDAVGGFKDGFKQGLSEAIQDAGNKATVTGTAFGFLKGAASGFLATISVQALASFTSDLLNYAGGLGEVAQQLGVTTEQLQVYRYAASQVGVSQEELDTGLSKLSKSLGDAALGSAQDVKTFSALGIAIKNANGDIKTAGEALPEIADALSQIPDPATRAALEMQIFGRAGQRLDTLLSGGSSAIDNLTVAARRLGVVLSNEQIQNADQTADKLSELKIVLSANIAGAVAQNAGAIYDLANSLIKLAASIPNAVRGWQRWRMVNQLRLEEEIENSPLGGLPQSIRGTNAAQTRQRIAAFDEETRRQNLLAKGLILGPGSTFLPADATPRVKPKVGNLDGLLAPAGHSGGGGGSKTKEKVDQVTFSLQEMNRATNDAIEDMARLLSIDPQEALDQASRKFFASNGIDTGNDDEAIVKEIDKRKDAVLQAADLKAETDEANFERQQTQIRDLAGLYEELFTGGTKGFLNVLKREGISIIAQLLAQLTVGAQPTAGGGGGLLGSLLQGAKLFASASGAGGFNVGANNASTQAALDSIGIFGRASGGYVAPGQFVRVNEAASPGNVEGFRPQGSGQIIPLGQMQAARGGGTSVIQYITLQAPNSILASELVQFVEQRSQEAAKAGAQGGYAAARRDMADIGRTRL